MEKVYCQLFLILFLVSSYAQAQVVFSPTIIATWPYQEVADESILNELSDYNREIEITDEIRSGYVQESLAENWKIIRGKELDYLKKQTFFSQISYLITTNLTYKIYEYHNHPLIYPVTDKTSSDKVPLRTLAKKYGVDWVINIVKMEVKNVDGEKVAEARIMLYNVVTDRIFLDKTYGKKPLNPGGQLECEAGSWQCALNSIVEEAVNDLFDQFEKNRRYWSTDG